MSARPAEKLSIAVAQLNSTVGDIAGNEWPPADALLRLMAQDKKVRAGQLTLILAHGIGRAFATRDIAAATVRDQFVLPAASLGLTWRRSARRGRHHDR